MILRRKQSISKGLRVLTALLLFTAFLGAPYFSGLTESISKVQILDMPGLTGAANNIIYIDDRYVLVAPYAPTEIENDGEDEGFDVEKLDNHYLYLIDTKKPNTKLNPADLKTCYFPSRVLYDPESRTVFIRGTEFYKNEKGGDASREVIVHVHLNLDTDGKPYFDPDPPVIIPIRGHKSEFSEDASSEFILGHKGKILVYTNGKSIFTYNVVTGDLYPVHFHEDSVTLLDIDEASNTLFVSLTRQEGQEEGSENHKSVLMFYRLRADGTVDLIKLVEERENGLSPSLVPGSNAAIITSLDSQTDEHKADLAFFVDRDGSLCQVDLRTAGTDGIAEGIAYFPDLDQADSSSPSPRKISYDRAKRTLSIVKRGLVWEIKRPTFNRPGRIKRPTFLRTSEPPALVLVQLNKKYRIVRQNTLTEAFAESGGLSNHILEESRVIVAGYDGKLHSVSLDDNLEQSTPLLIGEIGDRVEFIANRGSSTVFVAINSFEADEEGGAIVNPGSLAIAKLSPGNNQLASSLVRTLFQNENLAAALGRKTTLVW